MVKMVLNALMLCLAIPQVCNAQWVGAWQYKGADALLGLSTDPDQAESTETVNSFLIIGYRSGSAACRRVVTMLTMKGPKLQEAIETKLASRTNDQLIVKVGRIEYTDETAITRYTNAIELSMRASAELLSALADERSPLSVHIGSTAEPYAGGGFVFERASGFVSANESARANCH